MEKWNNGRRNLLRRNMAFKWNIYGWLNLNYALFACLYGILKIRMGLPFLAVLFVFKHTHPKKIIKINANFDVIENCFSYLFMAKKYLLTNRTKVDYINLFR